MGDVIRKREAGVLFERHAMVSSTMDVAKEVCSKENDTWICVSAEQQASGRGTSARKWVSPAGNVYVSICVPKSEVGIDKARFLPMYTAVGMHDTVHHFLKSSDAQVNVKWPNDVLVNGKKISGNIIEDSLNHYIVGIGINVLVQPEISDGGRTATCFSNFGVSEDPETVIEFLFNSLRKILSQPSTEFQAVAECSKRIDWNTPIYERCDDGSRGAEGKALRLTEDGHLIANFGGEEKSFISTYLF